MSDEFAINQVLLCHINYASWPLRGVRIGYRGIGVTLIYQRDGGDESTRILGQMVHVPLVNLSSFQLQTYSELL